MNALLTKPDSDRLFEVAESQQGYFSTPQAIAAGYARSTHSYHVHAGNWVREHRGVYRLHRYPRSEEGQLVRAVVRSSDYWKAAMTSLEVRTWQICGEMSSRSDASSDSGP